MIVSRSLFLALLAGPLGGLLPVQAAPSKPNILFILIDDMGWKDIACQGNPYLTDRKSVV